MWERQGPLRSQKEVKRQPGTKTLDSGVSIPVPPPPLHQRRHGLARPLSHSGPPLPHLRREVLTDQWYSKPLKLGGPVFM